MTCVCGCGTATARGKYYARGHNRKTWEATKVRPSFSGVHKRLAAHRGPAAEYDCVDCGQAAAEWSYDGLDSQQLTEIRRGSVATYSTDLNRYQPRCRPCHRRFDEIGHRDRDSSGHFIKEHV